MSQNSNDLTLVRRIVGFAKMGVALDAEIVKSAHGKYTQMVTEGVVPAEATAKVGAVLRSLSGGVLPAESVCRDAMGEMDAFLLPMRRNERAAQSMVVAPSTPRQRA
jgi:hypothetical protein